MRRYVHLEKMREKAEKWEARIGCMSRVNGEIEVDRGRFIWELLARPCLEHACEVWWTGGKAPCNNLEKDSREHGRKLVVASSTVAEVAVRGDLGRRKLEERRGKQQHGSTRGLLG